MKKSSKTTSVALAAMFLLGMATDRLLRPIPNLTDPLPKQNPERGGRSSDAGSPSGPAQREASFSTPSMPERTKLEARLFRYLAAADAELAETLNQMSEAESQVLARQLALFEDKMERHEVRNAKLISGPDSTIKISIPPLRGKG